MPLVDFPETADIETSSDDYARRFSGEIGDWFLRVQEEATLRMLAPHPGAKILDVGGGHGQLTTALVRHGYQVTVLGSADACKQRIQKYVDENRCSFKVGNILDLPYSDQAFAVVVSYRLLPHVTQWKQFLSELTRVAQESGDCRLSGGSERQRRRPIAVSSKEAFGGEYQAVYVFSGVPITQSVSGS